MNASTTNDLLPGLMPRAQWARAVGKCDKTAKRWQDEGLLVIRYIGRTPFVDTEKTAARLRGEDASRRGRKPAAK